MKKILILILITTFLTSCGPVYKKITEKKLIKTVSIEQGCPVENIKIIDKVKVRRGGTYALDVCNKRLVYKKVRGTFIESSKVKN